MSKLRAFSMPYPDALLQKWKNGKYGMLTSSKASDYLKGILVDKAKERRGTRRFFGESYVATKVSHRDGFYGSFKWLTNSRFVGGGRFGQGPTEQYKDRFRKALRDNFTKKQLRDLQQKANRLRGRKPVPPDLWLIDRKGNHRFIEVKLPGDRLGSHQLAGLALIAHCLRGRSNARVSVEIVELHANGVSESDKRSFRKVLRTLRTAG